MRWFIASGLVVLVGCSYDFGSFGQDGAGATGATGATGTTTGASPTSSTNASGATSSVSGASASGASGATSTAASASASSTGAGGGGALTPCGIAMDKFDSLDPLVWVSVPTISNGGNKITTTALAGHAGLYLLAGSTYTECYASIAVLDTPADQNGRVVIGVTDLVSTIENQYYEKHNPSRQLVAAPSGTTFSPPNDATHLGIAFHGATVHFLWADGSGWHDYAQTARPGWLDDLVGDHVAFGLEAMDGKTAVFDDYAVRPVTLGDLQ